MCAPWKYVSHKYELRIQMFWRTSFPGPTCAVGGSRWGSEVGYVAQLWLEAFYSALNDNVVCDFEKYGRRLRKESLSVQ